MIQQLISIDNSDEEKSEAKKKRATALVIEETSLSENEKQNIAKHCGNRTAAIIIELKNL